MPRGGEIKLTLPSFSPTDSKGHRKSKKDLKLSKHQKKDIDDFLANPYLKGDQRKVKEVQHMLQYECAVQAEEIIAHLGADWIRKLTIQPFPIYQSRAGDFIVRGHVNISSRERSCFRIQGYSMR